MGPDSDPMAVVDAQLRVKGIAGLRGPTLPSCPPWWGQHQCTSIMIGEKCADLIRASR